MLQRAKRREVAESEARQVLKSWHKDADAACRAYHLFNGRSIASLLNYRPTLIRRAVAYGWMHWPRLICDDISGRDVLDVGCGSGLKGIAYLTAGVRSYTGMDPKLDLDSDLVKNPKTREWEHFGCTPRALRRRCPKIQLIPGSFELVAPRRRFDIALMHNVTEHLMQIEQVFADVAALLRPGGLLIFSHHNFACWNGHHSPPKYIDDIDPADPEQRKFIDWNHLTYQPDPDEYVATKLNRIRLDDLRALTEQHFEILTWEESPSDVRRGADRLTQAVRERHPDYTERELRTQNVFCRAQRDA